MRIAVPREHAPFERRVALVPEIVHRLVDAGHEVVLERDAGAEAFFTDEQYTERGATIASDLIAATEGADIVCKVQAPTLDEAAALASGAALVSFLQPLTTPDVAAELASSGITAFSLDLLPRISRAQSMDALSSQALVSGYRCSLIAANSLPRFFPMFMTAAGTVPPAKVLVLGAGVAGLQAIATARRLGALVRANDVRPAAAEEVRSLGATFVDLPIESQEGSGGYARTQSEDFLARQRELIATEVAAADAVITTAAVPGRPAPVLVTAEMVAAMSPGSIVVDMAAETGGNCELSVAGETIVQKGVSVYGARNLPSQMPVHASFLYSRNVFEFVSLLIKDGERVYDFSDEIVAATCVTHEGSVRHEATAELLKGGGQ